MSLIRYIQGIRKGKEAHRLEKEAMRDPFLHDALDGYDKIKGNHPEQIERLRKKVFQKSASRKNRYPLFWNIAASILVIFTIGGGMMLYRFFAPDQPMQTVERQKDVMIEAEPSDPVMPDTLIRLQAEKKVEKAVSPALIAQVKTKSTTDPAILRDEEITDSQIITEETVVIEPGVAEKLIVAADLAAAQSLPEYLETPLSAENQITGKVVDETGEPLTGASVRLAGTNKGTITDLEGNFVLPAANDSQIEVNFIGYEPVILPIDQNKSMLIAMNEDQNTLSEVVVTGYGTQKKSNIIRSITNIFSKNGDFDDYVKQELVRPTDEECKEAKGVVTLVFRVDENSRPYNIIVKKSLCPSADKEAVRLLETGPDWSLTKKEITKKIRF